MRMPMRRGERCLNLSNAVAVGVYEALRQWDFADLETHGQLTRYEWSEDVKMSKIGFLTDSCSDIPQELADKYGIEVVGFPINLDGVGVHGAQRTLRTTSSTR